MSEFRSSLQYYSGLHCQWSHQFRGDVLSNVCKSGNATAPSGTGKVIQCVWSAITSLKGHSILILRAHAMWQFTCSMSTRELRFLSKFGISKRDPIL